MPLTIGARLGPYEILAALGAGAATIENAILPLLQEHRAVNRHQGLCACGLRRLHRPHPLDSDRLQSDLRLTVGSEHMYVRRRVIVEDRPLRDVASLIGSEAQQALDLSP